MISPAALQELKDRNPVDAIARQWVALRRGGKLGNVGPCPIHSPDRQARDSTSFECNGESWVCVTCADGGDVVRLVQLVEGKDFLAAVEWLGGAREVDEAQSAQRERDRLARQAQRDTEASHYRERERRKLFDIWTNAGKLYGSPAQDYLNLRGIIKLPPGAKLRCVEQMPYFADGSDKAEVIHRGPAMVAAIIGADGRFSGLHLTYIDLTKPKGKLALGEDRPSKKMRGSSKGGRVELTSPPMPTQLIMGEGTETTLSVWLALNSLGRDLSATAFWAAMDLGNLGGKHAETVRHPSLKDAAGRARRVPGPMPDMDAPSIPIPDSVTDLVLLGDGDSDAFLTNCALCRAAARYARDGRTVRVAWAPAGRDFGDLLMAA